MNIYKIIYRDNLKKENNLENCRLFFYIMYNNVAGRHSSAVEHSVHARSVSGSNPLAATIHRNFWRNL